METITYYIDLSRNVYNYVCVLDASKAFDCMNLLKLIPDLHCTTNFLNYLLIRNCTDTYNHPTLSQDLSYPPPPPHMPLCNHFDILIFIRIATFSLYCHIRNWFIHEIDNHIVDLLL